MNDLLNSALNGSDNGAARKPEGGAVLVVEDDLKIAAVVIDYLRADGLDTRHVADGTLVLDEVRRHPPSLILLDLMLPGMGGVEVCTAVRRFSAVPIIMLTARVDEIDRLLGLDSGADDYVCKPFSPRELMARVKAQLRRARGQLVPAPTPWSIDDDKLQVRWRGAALGLTLIEFRLLRRLLERPGRVCSRARLMEHLYEDDRDVSDRAIDSHIKNLRRKMVTIDAGFNGITSVYGVGYCFDAPSA
jgi:two-component system, OmpR family, response regulator BaeR